MHPSRLMPVRMGLFLVRAEGTVIKVLVEFDGQINPDPDVDYGMRPKEEV